MYDWNITFTVSNTDLGTNSYHYVDNCTSMETVYEHKYIGMATAKTDAELLVKACTVVTLGEGILLNRSRCKPFGSMGRWNRNTR